jgi:DNA-binding transcriptional LysR family regulator
MDLIHHMRLFVRVVQAGSFSAVAREQGISQPTVSKQIAQLEQHLGMQLLARSTTQLQLTEAGAEAYGHVTRLLEQVSLLEGNVGRLRDVPSGRLRVSAPVEFGNAYLVPLLLTLSRTYEHLEVDLVLSDRWFDLIQEGIDVAIRFGPLPDSRLVARRIGVSRQACLASPAYLKRHKEPRTPRDLEGHHCIVNSLLSPTNRWEFHTERGNLAVQVKSRFRTNNLQTIRAAVLNGSGIAVGPLWLYFEDVNRGRVRRILQDFEPAPLDISALYAPSTFQPVKVKAFLAALSDELARTPAFAGKQQGSRRLPRPLPVGREARAAAARPRLRSR